MGIFSAASVIWFRDDHLCHTVDARDHSDLTHSASRADRELTQNRQRHQICLLPPGPQRPAKLNIMQLLSPTMIAGAERVVLTLLTHIDRRLFNPYVCLFTNARTRHNSFVDELTRLGIRPHIIYLDRIFRWRYVRELRDLLKRHDVDILHTHSHRADITGYLAARSSSARLVATVHGWTSSSAKLSLYKTVDKHVLKRFDRLIAVSANIKNMLRPNGSPDSRVRVIGNALDFSMYSTSAHGSLFRQQLPFALEHKLVGTVARLSKEKALVDFLRVAQNILAKRQDIRFVIVGEGPERHNLLQLRERMGLTEHVHLAGYVKDVSRVYAALDVFLLTSLNEGLPISLLEAAYFGTPLVATRVGGIPELFEGRALTANPGDIDRLARQIMYLLNNQVQASRYGGELRNYVLDKCDPAAWISEIERIYLDLGVPHRHTHVGG